jgi:hypothetical protein
MASSGLDEPLQNSNPTMSKLKAILLLLLVFISAIFFAFYFDNSYRLLVRNFFKLFQGDKIKFISSKFDLFPDPYFLISFGLFGVLFSWFLYRERKLGSVLHVGLVVSLFFITTMMTTYLDSTSKVIECTACKEAISLHWNEVNYNFHFITSLVVALVPLLWAFFKKQLLTKRNELRGGS